MDGPASSGQSPPPARPIFQARAVRAMMKLKGSVGAGGRNDEDDVRLVQSLLNRSLTSVEPLLKVDGKIGPRTLQAIERFQRVKLGRRSPDRRVDPGGATFSMLA